MIKILPSLRALLARLPSDAAELDLVTLVVVVLAGIGLFTEVIAPSQLPSAIDVLLGAATVIGIRGASLAAKKREPAIAGAQALSDTAGAIRAGVTLEGVPELVHQVEVVVEAVRLGQDDEVTL